LLGPPLRRQAPRLACGRVSKKIYGILAGFAGVGAILGGFTGYWTMYRAVWTESRAPAESETLGARLSIIVLPFLNLRGDAQQDYFTDGITDSLTTDLSRALPGGFVVARDTAFTYKGQAVDVRRLQRELNVRYVLEGSVLLDGEQLRVNARLVDTRTTRGIWAERFDTARRDLLQVQDEIVGRLSRAIGLEVTEVEARRREGARSRSPDAMDLVMRGWAAANRPTSAASMINARELFERAIHAQTDNVDALAGVATTYVFEVLNGYYPTGNDERLEQADTAQYADRHYIRRPHANRRAGL
jgi:TolB-like protein